MPALSPTELQESSSSTVLGVGTLNVSARAKELVLEALNNNRLSYGPLTKRFESDFAAHHECRFGIMSNSGTSSLQVALQAMKEMHGWEDGDEVIVPAVTFVATANIVLHNRMLPVLVDVDSTYYDLDVSQLESKITSRTRAIIPVHLFGHPADMDPIREIANHYNLKIIEDTCETMFANYHGRRVGSLGDIGCFSTYVAHLLVTGVGGLSLTNDPEYAVRMRSLVNHGRDSIYISIDDDKGKTSEELKMIIAKRFKFVSVGHSYRATELEAALGLAQLEHWETMIAIRRANARSLTNKLSRLDTNLQLPSTRPGSDHSFMMYPVVLADRPKTDLVQFLEQHGVETRDMLPLTNQPVYHRLLGWREEDYPVAKWINQNGFYVGCHQDMTESDLDYVAELFERYFRRRPTVAREGAVLVMSTSGDQEAVERALEEVPRDLFDRIILVEEKPAPGIETSMPAKGIEVVKLDGRDLLDFVLDPALGIEQDSIVFFSADSRHNPRDVGRLLLALERGQDMVVASRFMHGGARHDRYQRLRYRSTGNRVLTLLANLLFFGNFSDTLNTFRAVRRHKLQELQNLAKGLPGFYELSIDAMKKHWNVTEVPTVELLSRETNDRTKVALSILPLLSVLMKEWWRSDKNKEQG